MMAEIILKGHLFKCERLIVLILRFSSAKIHKVPPKDATCAPVRLVFAVLVNQAFLLAPGLDGKLTAFRTMVFFLISK